MPDPEGDIKHVKTNKEAPLPILDAPVKQAIEAVIKDQDKTATDFHHRIVVDSFVNVGRMYFTTYTSDDDDFEPDDCFVYTIASEDSKEFVFCEDGVRLLQELRRILDLRRSFWQMIGDFHLYELITFCVTMFFVLAFILSLFYVLLLDSYYFESSLAGMFLTILGFYFGKEVVGLSGSAAKSRIQSEIIAALKLMHPSAASVAFERVFSRFLGVSTYYIEFTPANNEEIEFSYAVVEPDGIEIYPLAEKVVLSLRSALLKRQKLLLRFEELGLFELASAAVAIVLSAGFLVTIALKLSPPVELVGAMNLVIGYFFAKNAQTNK